MNTLRQPDSPYKLLQSYNLTINNILVQIEIVFPHEESVPLYHVNIANMTKTTKLILEKIREEFVQRVGLGAIELAEGGVERIKYQFRREINSLLDKYFPNTDARTKDMLVNYMIEQNLELGNLEIPLQDANIEEIVVNGAKEPVWVYHKTHGWLKSNIVIPTEERIRHFSTQIGRDVNKEITVLDPLMDAHLLTGDRVNATLAPVSSSGNTITIRKFRKDPWTVADLIKSGTLDYYSASLIWLCFQYELSALITGGTGSGKTSTLNALSAFIPPNQRVISIEDTRELRLPGSLHWVPMETRSPNPEGKGEITMLDLVVNSLRMRPDRIIMGEVRRKRETEVLFEAMHTGHSVYATFHANDADETITRLTNPPIDVPRLVLPAMNLIVVQSRNRVTNKRRTSEIAEIMPNGEPNVVLKLDIKKDQLVQVGKFQVIPKLLKMLAGLDIKDIEDNLNEKQRILRWMVKQNIRDVDKIGLLMSQYYRGLLKV